MGSTVVMGTEKFLCLCTCGSKVFCAPWASMQLLIYDVLTDEIIGVDIQHISPHFRRFATVCETNGMVIAPPFYGDQLLVYNIGTQKVRGVKISGALTWMNWPNFVDARSAFGSICTVGDRVVAAPDGADQLLVYCTTT